MSMTATMMAYKSCYCRLLSFCFFVHDEKLPIYSRRATIMRSHMMVRTQTTHSFSKDLGGKTSVVVNEKKQLMSRRAAAVVAVLVP